MVNMVNGSLAQLSNSLTYSAIAVYVVALVLYAADLAFGARGVVARTAAPVAVGGGASTLEDSQPSPRWNTARLGRSAVALTVLGFGLQLAALVARGLAAQRVPWGNMYEFSSVAARWSRGFLVC